jgi:hypothetical protein
MKRLPKRQKEIALSAIEHMRCKDLNPERLRNFIRINFRVEISIETARKWWTARCSN